MPKIEVILDGRAWVLDKVFIIGGTEEVLLCLLPQNETTPFAVYERTIGGRPDEVMNPYYFPKLSQAVQNWIIRAGAYPERKDL